MSRSSKTRFHRNGERTPPWGHPLDIFQVSVVGPDFSVIVRDFIMLVIHLMANCSALVFLRLSSILSWGRLSKAPCMSRKTPKTCPFWFLHFSILFMTLAIAASVENPALKPI